MLPPRVKLPSLLFLFLIIFYFVIQWKLIYHTNNILHNDTNEISQQKKKLATDYKQQEYQNHRSRSSSQLQQQQTLIHQDSSLLDLNNISSNGGDEPTTMVKLEQEQIQHQKQQSEQQQLEIQKQNNGNNYDKNWENHMRDANNDIITVNNYNDNNYASNSHLDKNRVNADYETDSLCGGCRFAYANVKKRIPCGLVILRTMRNANQSEEIKNVMNITSLRDAAVYASIKFPTTCKRCNPLSCNRTEKVYWKYDIAAPRVLHSSTHYLSSIPSHHRIPKYLLVSSSPSHSTKVKNDNNTIHNDTIIENLVNYFSNPENVFPNKEYLFEYNPSIVKIPRKQIPHVPDANNQPVYLASYRISTKQSCFPTFVTRKMIGGVFETEEKDNRKRNRGKELGALALLRSDLSIITDITFLPSSLPKRDDYRLHILHDQMYISSRAYIVPLYINATTTISNVTTTNTSNVDESISDDTSEYYTFDLNSTIKKIHPRFEAPPSIISRITTGNVTTKTTTRFTFMIGKEATMCCTKDKNVLISAKNLNYFVDNNNQTLVEIFPADKIDDIDLNVVGNHVYKRFIRTSQQENLDQNNIDRNKNDVLPSFYTIEESYYPNNYNVTASIFTDDRGGTCCIVIPDPRIKKGKDADVSSTLFLGISHVKTPYGRKSTEGIVPKNQYLSRFYAFEPISPYTVVAKSGLFCFGFPSSNNDSNSSSNNEMENNPLVKVNLFDVLTLATSLNGNSSSDDKTEQQELNHNNGNNDDDTNKMNCPRIHFISGMTEKADDENKVIIGYGVNDCFSRFVEVYRSEIIRLLFNQPLMGEAVVDTA